MVKLVEPTGLPLVDGLASLDPQTIEDYCRASAEYIRQASVLGAAKSKAAQIRLSNALAAITLTDLRGASLAAPHAVAGEREVGGGLRSVKADVSETTTRDGLTLAIEVKPVHLAVGRAIWNRFGDIRTFAVNLHLKFPFAVVGGILTLPTSERFKSGDDEHWKSTAHLVTRAVGRFIRAGGRVTEGDAAHLLEGIAVVAFDRLTGDIEPDLPPAGSGLRWDEFISSLAEVYDARFGEI
ncbi:MAG: hypothetical protein AB1673_01335 [Actinomycetota bacterium]|jgi:hypothetical protein